MVTTILCSALTLLSAVAPLPQEPLAAAQEAVQRALDEGAAPGAVLLVQSGGDRLVERAFGRVGVADALLPSDGAGRLRADAVFDLASLTKPVATATAVMKLVDDGEVELDAPVVRYLPEFAPNGKDAITVAHLLLHRGGLIPDNALSDYDDGPEEAWRRICALDLRSKPGEEFKYTDVGFIALGKLVEAVDGRSLDQFTREEIFGPLGMDDTTFRPGPELRARCVPTERRGDTWMRGEVHDPRAFRMGGVAGHAGLFSTAQDLAVWCEMLMNGGAARVDGKEVRILSQRTALEMTRPRWLRDGSGGRALGLDVDTGYSSPRGSRFPRGASFGHTGFTGTSLWIDPTSSTYVILLTSRCHPDGKGSVVPLRRAVADAVTAELGIGPPPPAPHVRSGVDVLAAEDCARLAGQRVAVITNVTGRTRDGRRTIDVLAEAEAVDLVRIFSPEHGLFAKGEGKIGDATDEVTGLPVFSLYGETRKPTPEMLEGLDAVVFDIQDVGVRYYTYISTLGLAMEACGEAGVTVVVLDRPNPLGGELVTGPIVDEDRMSFIGWRPLPVVHGMTVGEIARMFRAEWGGIECDLEVVRMEGWDRGMSWERTGQVWIDPSPNMRNTTQAVLYPCTGLLEGTNLSVGRGTDEPFELFGAPWIDGPALAASLNGAGIAGLEFTAIEFTPDASKFEGEPCHGVHLTVTDREALEPVKAGLAIIWTLNRLHPRDLDLVRANDRLRSDATFMALIRSADWRDIDASWRAPLARFVALREPHLIY